MAAAVGIVEISVILYMGFLIIGGVILLDLISKAFNKDFLSGVICLLFPIGTYFYCKQNWQEKKLQATSIIVCCIGAIFFRMVSYLLT